VEPPKCNPKRFARVSSFQFSLSELELKLATNGSGIEIAIALQDIKSLSDDSKLLTTQTSNLPLPVTGKSPKPFHIKLFFKEQITTFFYS